MRFHSLLIAAACVATPQGAVADFVVPSEYTSVESPTAGNALPFINGGDTRCQQIYLESDIPNGPFTIYGVAFRPDEAGIPAAIQRADVDITLSLTIAGSTSLDTSFGSNVGFNPTLVRSGALQLSTQVVGPAGGPKAFDAVIWFDTPYPYNAGDLMLDVRIGSTESSVLYLDAIGSPGDAIGRLCSAAAFGGGAGTATGFADSGGLVTKFLLPELENGASALVALAVLALRARGAAR